MPVKLQSSSCRDPSVTVVNVIVDSRDHYSDICMISV